MGGSKGSESVRGGKNALLPPKIPFPSVSAASASYSEYIPCGLMGSRHAHKATSTHHHRTSSESHLVEELPFWLDDLLNDPETETECPAARISGHRRSASDSYANISDFSYRNPLSSSIHRGIQELDRSKNNPDGSFLKHRNRQLLASYMSQDATSEAVSHDIKRFSFEESNSTPLPEADNTKRAKQQFAQRSRVRKLQYISELERNVQTLQAEGSKVSAELEFLNQRNLILSMENKALKHRLESIAQEKLIKQLEQEMLENEIGRLRALYQQQQQHTHKPSANHKRATTSKDLESQFSSLSLNTKDSNCRRDSVSVMGQFHF